jgi:hypothetical protein
MPLSRTVNVDFFSISSVAAAQTSVQSNTFTLTSEAVIALHTEGIYHESATQGCDLLVYAAPVDDVNRFDTEPFMTISMGFAANTTKRRTVDVGPFPSKYVRFAFKNKDTGQAVNGLKLSITRLVVT